jgi:hypothetical protein
MRGISKVFMVCRQSAGAPAIDIAQHVDPKRRTVRAGLIRTQVTIQRTEHLGSASLGSGDDRVVVRVDADAGHHRRIDQLSDQHQVLDELIDLAIRQAMQGTQAIVTQHASQFSNQKGRQYENMLVKRRQQEQGMGRSWRSHRGPREYVGVEE